MAGPIERAKDLIPQIKRSKTFKLEDIYEGTYLVVWGLFKKVYIADGVAKTVNMVFSADVAELIWVDIVLVSVMFAFQIYCDFSGYTDMARGVAKCLGFNLRLNFNLPYFSKSPTEFWTKWHISLSSWLKDYLYIPLGGGSKGAIINI